MRFVVAQIGPRARRYAVPGILHRAGMLEHFYTDICAIRGLPSFLGLLPRRVLPAALRRLCDRVPVGVSKDRITTFDLFGIEYWLRLRMAKYASDRRRLFLWAGKSFANNVAGKNFDGAQGVYAFSSAALEVFEAARARGLRTVADQIIAPHRVEKMLLDQEREMFPDWEIRKVEDGAWSEFASREEAEWQKADLILCGSEFVKEGIRACSGPEERCLVVPYGVDARFRLPARKPHQGPLRVLTVGSVGLRKGSPYVLEAARRLRGKALFRMVGGIGASARAEGEMRKYIDLTGHLPRSEILKCYFWADVFLLPSICEGSATVTYEALAAGLPVVCTPNTGSVVRDGVDGFIVPIRSAEAIVETLERLIELPDMLRTMSDNARERAGSYDLANYERRLVAALNTLDLSPGARER